MMSKNLYVGNLSFETTADDLREAFGQYGCVTSAQVVDDRDTGRSKGFGFVEMSDGAEAAIAAMNGKELRGRSLNVSEARPRVARSGPGGRRDRD
jgi:RNA recognition motif-containing protein